MVLVSIVVLIGSLAWLKEWTFHHSRNVYRVEFPETGGLAANDAILVNGLRKGEVKSMKLVGDRVIVELSLAKDVNVTTDSRVAIRNVGLMGERVIAVDLKASGRTYAENELIQGRYEKSMGEVMSGLGETVDALSDLSVELRRVTHTIVGDGDLARTVDNFGRTSEELRLVVSENRAAVTAALQDFASASRSAKNLMADREEQIRGAIDDFASAANKMDQLSGKLDSLHRVIQNVSNRVERGEGTLGKLVQDDRLYAELNESVQSLKALIEDIKANPKKYFKISVF
jgi:phospholipid/cholesterol/gamma-HCH transport system substrate-binding protein